MSPAADVGRLASTRDGFAAADLPAGLAAAIEEAVRRHGGDADDARELAQVWRRVSIDTERRAAAIRSSVARARCRCADGGDFNGHRCARCYGRRADSERRP